MNEKQNEVAQLNSIIESLEQERGRISIVGRALTPQEEHRLSQIGEAVPLLRSAVEKLTAEPTAG